MSPRKREGDGKSPMGTWQVQSGMFRADRLGHGFPRRSLKALRASDGWCDDPGHRAYNRPVSLPFTASHEALWRDDSAYDVLLFTNHNQKPRQRFGGSAIFFHLIRPGATCTAGCIAVSLADMRKLLALTGPRFRLVIG